MIDFAGSMILSIIPVTPLLVIACLTNACLTNVVQKLDSQRFNRGLIRVGLIAAFASE